MRLHYEGILEQRLDELGEMPLPPYIKERLDIRIDIKLCMLKKMVPLQRLLQGYILQMSFTENKDKGVNIAFITLHVGLGTFRPVSVEDIDDHEMHSEYYQMTKETADMLNKTKEMGIELFL